MTKVMDWLTANKLSLNISITKYMLITNKHVITESFVIDVNSNRIGRTLTYKYLGIIVDEKLSWKEHCKQLCCTMSKYVGAMHKVKHYVNNQALRMLNHSLINSRAQYGIIAWGRAASCHLQPISVILNCAVRCFNQVFLRRFRDPIRMPRIENRVATIRENHYRVPRIKENRVTVIREIGSLQVHIGYLTFSLKKTLLKHK